MCLLLGLVPLLVEGQVREQFRELAGEEWLLHVQVQVRVLFGGLGSSMQEGLQEEHYRPVHYYCYCSESSDSPWLYSAPKFVSAIV